MGGVTSISPELWSVGFETKIALGSRSMMWMDPSAGSLEREWSLWIRTQGVARFGPVANDDLRDRALNIVLLAAAPQPAVLRPQPQDPGKTGRT